MTRDDPTNLQRFVDAQDPVYGRVLAELGEGKKRSHWMWFIFPQIRGLGFSSVSQRFGIASRAEAQAYLAHPVLGPRLLECTTLVVGHDGRSAHDIFGSPDDLKFRSSMTLFADAVPGSAIFTDALKKYYGGVPDSLTLARL